MSISCSMGRSLGGGLLGGKDGVHRGLVRRDVDAAHVPISDLWGRAPYPPFNELAPSEVLGDPAPRVREALAVGSGDEALAEPVLVRLAERRGLYHADELRGRHREAAEAGPEGYAGIGTPVEGELPRGAVTT